jgi:hypothetical protein
MIFGIYGGIIYLQEHKKYIFYVPLIISQNIIFYATI